MLSAVSLGLVIAAQSAGGIVEVEDEVQTSRVIVRELKSEFLDSGQLAIIGQALTLELKKLEGIEVIAMRDLKTLLEIEVERQLVGCSDDASCLAEIADSMGADGWLGGDVALIGTERVLSLSRFDVKSASVTHRAQVRLDTDDDAGLLTAIGPSVKTLFPELSLKEGETRGVDAAMAAKMRPPPLPSWLLWTTAAATVAAGVVAGGLGGYSLVEYQESERLYQKSAEQPISAVEARGHFDAAQGALLGAQVAAGAAAFLAITTLVLVPLTDFEAQP